MFFNHSLEITAFNQVRYPQVEFTRSELQKLWLQLHPAVCLVNGSVRSVQLCNSLEIETVSNKETT